MLGTGSSRTPVVLLLALAATLASTAATAQVEAPISLRVQWGGGQAKAWVGEFRIQGGRISDVKRLGVEPDAASAVRWTAGRVSIDHAYPRPFCGFDVECIAAADAVLTFDVAPRGEQRKSPVELPLSQFSPSESAARVDLNDEGAFVVIQRTPGDYLHVEPLTPSLVLSPNTGVRLRVEPRDFHAAGKKSNRWRIRQRLERSADGEKLWQDVRELTDEPLAFNAPVQEGVYNLRLDLLTKGLGLPAKSIAQRTVQFVVMDALPDDDAGEMFWKQIHEIDPRGKSWRQALPDAAARFSGEPAGEGAAEPWPLVSENRNKQAFVRLLPDAVSNSAWRAFPLEIQDVDRAHLLEIEYPANREQHLYVGVFDNAGGASWTSLGVDRAIIGLDGEVQTESSNSPNRKRLTFWPKSRTTWAVVAADSDGAVFGKMRLFAATPAEAGVLAKLPWPATATKSNEINLPSTFKQPPQGGRWFAAWCGRPLFAGGVAAPRIFDAGLGREIDDWNTFYYGANRLTNQAKSIGVNALFVNAAADGAALYPSTVWGTSPRYDSGVFASHAADPIRKDAIEALARSCTANGLMLVPTLQFRGALPHLERMLKNEDPRVSGLLWVNHRGETMGRGTGAEWGPRYNPLLPGVQQAAAAAVVEVMRRYAQSANVAGVAVQLHPRDFLTAPGPEWGYDDATIALFSSETGVPVPHDGGPERFTKRYDALFAKPSDPSHRAAWLRWRQDRMDALYLRMQSGLAQVRADAKLFVLANELLQDDAIRKKLRPEPFRSPAMIDVLRDVGVDAVHLSRGGIILVRPDLIDVAGGVKGSGLAAEAASTLDVDSLLTNQGPVGASFWRPRQGLRLDNPRSRPPLPGTQASLIATPSEVGRDRLRGYVAAFARNDVMLLLDGAEAPLLDESPELQEFLRVYRELPPQVFRQAAEADPLILRSWNNDVEAWCYVVNPTNREIHAQLSAVTNSPAPPRRVGDDEPTPWSIEQAGVGKASLVLKPYDLQAFVFGGRVESFALETEPDAALAQALRERLQNLWRRAAVVREARPLPPVENYAFEGAADGELGWAIEGAVDSTAAIDGRFADGGRQSLRLSSRDSGVSVVSSRFRPPDSGRLELAVAVRGSGDAEPRVHLIIEDVVSQVVWDSAIGRDTSFRVQEKWRQFKLPISDLPATDDDRLRVRIRLVGAGEAWIDEVQLRDPEFDKEELAAMTRALSNADLHLNQGKLDACERFFNSYWSRYLEENISLFTAPEVENLPTHAAESESLPNSAAEKLTTAGRFKKWLRWW